MMTPLVSLSLSLAIVLATAVTAQQHEHGAGEAEKLGTVTFQTSCTAQAQPLFNRAVALLHSFEFSRAIAGFNAALAADPTCAMADWGIALSRWSNFFAPGVRPAGVLRQGQDAVTQAKAIGLKTPREAAYVEAVSQLYVNVENSDQPARLLAYRDRMAALAAEYPDDTEASIFYALALLLWAAAIWSVRPDWLAILTLAPAALHLASQVLRADPKQGELALRLFRSNRSCGLLVFFAMLVVGLTAR